MIFAYDAERPWCVGCLTSRVEFPTAYYCPVCEPRPPKPFPALPKPLIPENAVVQPCGVLP